MDYRTYFKKLLKQFKDEDINFLTEDYLKMLLEKKRLKGSVLVERVFTEHEGRKQYDKFAEKLKKCRTVPQYLYVYCDAVKNQLIGDKFGRLMRIVRVPNDGRETETVIYGRPQFKYVSHHSFYQFEVNIRDESGCPVSFAKGPVIITLQFKRIS